MPRSAIVAEPVAGEPGEQVVLLLNLGEIRPPAALSATVADAALLAGEGGADDVRTMPVALEAGAFAAVALRAGADADLVEPASLGAARDEPTAAALVAVEDLVAVKLEETGAAKDVSGLCFGSGWWRGLR